MKFAVRIVSASAAGKVQYIAAILSAIFAIITVFLISLIRDMISAMRIFSAETAGKTQYITAVLSAIFTIVAILFFTVIRLVKISMRIFSAAAVGEISDVAAMVSAILAINICHNFFPFCLFKFYPMTKFPLRL